MQAHLTALALMVAIGSPVFAQTPVRPIVRAALEPSGAVTVGQPVLLHVEILVPTFFMQPPSLPAIEIPNATATLEDGAMNVNDRVDGRVWSGIRRQYRVVAQVPGTVAIPPVPVVVRYAIDGRLSDPFTVPTPPLSFEARIPPGAEALDYFFTARDLRLTQRFDRPPTTLKLGDAFTRTITLAADDVSALSLPPVRLSAPDGVTLHTDPPAVSTTGGDRGAPDVVSRVERATYTATKAGHYELPPITVPYWNPQASRVRAVSLPAVTFDVEAAAAFGEEIALPPDPVEAATPTRPPWMVFAATWWRVLATGAGAILLLVWLLRTYGGRVRDAWVASRRRRAESESHYFAIVKAAARRGDLRALNAAALAWLARVPECADSPTLAAVAARSGDAVLARDVQVLHRGLYGAPTGSSADPGLASRLIHGLTRARRRLLQTRAGGRALAGAALAPLNPDLTSTLARARGGPHR